MKKSGSRKKRPVHALIKDLMERYGGKFSTALGITLEGSNKNEVFKWFLASILFGARISEKIATRTYWVFIKNDLKTYDRILEAGWDRIVEVLDSGGYARYDFKTATKLLEVMNNLKERYQGDLNILHATALSPRDLERKITELGKGIGEVTTNIFLRELRGIWEKADPPLQELAINAAQSLGFTKRRFGNYADGTAILAELQKFWVRSGVEGRSFTDFEDALVRYGKDVLRKRGGSKRVG